ncbi:MAG: hypothetical protein AAFY02_10960 [Pseudomonadota bacterium]
MQRRQFLSLCAGAGTLGAALSAAQAETTTAKPEVEDCGCSPAKTNVNARAERLYQRALAASDPDRRRRLLELALKTDPQHQEALAALDQIQ